MEKEYLKDLSAVVKILLEDASIKETIKNLKLQLRKSNEPFIGSAIRIESFRERLPQNIKSAWVFVNKKNVLSIVHYHPNSTQHTVIVEGKGEVKIAGRCEEMRLFNQQNEDCWYVIDNNVAHEFYPKGREMVVISFHTCLSNELIEIKCDSGKQRLYETVKK
ncbi:MAG: cupin domain-containing protein [bacterium]